MHREVEFKLANGATIRVDGDEAAVGAEDLILAANPNLVIAQAQDTFEAAVQKITPVADALITALKGAKQPDEIGVEFSVKMSAGAGVVVASTEVEGNFKISLLWKKPS